MATQYDTAIQQLYVAYFNRPADAAGLAFWGNVATNNGGSTTAISAAFASSTEYQVAYNQTTNAGVVTQIYQNLFGRPPEAAGLAFWVKALTDKSITVDNMVTTIATAAQGADKVAFDSKVVVANAFTAALDTPAEQAGYAGADANTAAKALLSGIKTAAQATAAIVPATLDASVAAVIKAGVPFTLENGLAALGTAQKAIADFLDTAVVLDANGDALEVVTPTDIAAYVVRAENAVASDITVGTYVAGVDANNDGDTTDTGDTLGSLPGIKAALIAEQKTFNASAVTTAQTALSTAQTAIAGVTGLAGAIAAMTSAEAAAEEAATNAQIAVLNEVNADAALTVRNPGFTIVDAAPVNGEAVITVQATTGATRPVITVAELEDGVWSIPTGVNAATYPGLAELVAARNTVISATAEAAEAQEGYIFSQVEVEFRDRTATGAGTDALKDIPFDSVNGPQPAADAVPTLAQIRDELNALRSEGLSTDDFFAAIDDFLEANVAVRANAVVTAEANVKTATDRVADLDKDLSALDTAKALATELKGLNANYDVAIGDFDANDYVQPAMITGAKFGTTGSDIFVFADTTATITSFGRSGDDVLYVGNGFTLNEGALSTGNNAALEVFFNQKGANAEIIIETETYGSDLAASAGVKVITLTGVNIADLNFDNGIITL
jgi:hypothetical protein